MALEIESSTRVWELFALHVRLFNDWGGEAHFGHVDRDFNLALVNQVLEDPIHPLVEPLQLAALVIG